VVARSKTVSDLCATINAPPFHHTRNWAGGDGVSR
jgi:hypothetical protein